VVLHDGLQVLGVLSTTQLIILHDQLDQPLVLPDAIYYCLEIALELVAGQIDLLKVVIVANESFTDDIGRLEAHSLISE